MRAIRATELKRKMDEGCWDVVEPLYGVASDPMMFTWWSTVRKLMSDARFFEMDEGKHVSFST